jgi:hypothetical protein
MEVSLAVIEPGKGVVRAVELRKLHLVGSGGKVKALSPLLVVALPLAILVQWSCVTLGALHVSHPGDRFQNLLLCGVLLDGCL